MAGQAGEQFFLVPDSVISGTVAAVGARPVQPVPETSPGTACRIAGTGTVSGTMGTMTTAPAYDNSVRIGYARVSTRAQEHQAQLDALGAAHCREIIVETASTRGDRPKLREALGKLQGGDTLVIYKPDRVARSMKELLVLLEDQLHARGIKLHILTGICAGIHRPDGATIADKMLFMVAAMAAEMERDLIRERTLDGLRAAEAQGRRGGRPVAVNNDVLAVARARQARGESVTAIARHLKIGRSTLYRALQPHEADLAPAAAGPVR
jgi:DNA invertase Pin-like site-specific DNA recombinase